MTSISNTRRKSPENSQKAPSPASYSTDRKLNELLNSVVREVKLYAEDQIKHIKNRAQIGLALSKEKNINRLLEMIVDEARAQSHADAGTLYTVDSDQTHLRFEILQNDTMNIRMGGTSGQKIDLPKVPLYHKERPNLSNVSSYVALTGEIIIIPDVYEAKGFDFTGPRKYDAATGYRSRSMLVIPLKNHENDIIGVLQLLNAKNCETGKVVEFSPEYVDEIASLASQAAIALTNTQLIQDLKNLFYSFIQSIATAIDEKSPYTGGHIRRVVDITMMIAEKINQAKEGVFKDVSLNDDEIEELRLAAWMHDVGKIITPEYVVDKATRLETIFDRIQIIETRFRLIGETIQNEYQRRKLDLLENNALDEPTHHQLNRELSEKLDKIQTDLDYIRSCNNAGKFMTDDDVLRIHEIAAQTYSTNGRRYSYLTDDEVNNLCIRKGSLTDSERKIIENHAVMTLKILNQLPFPRKLSNVPKYAGEHHEKIDGTGYPRGICGKELSLQSRIMAIADIFEALTAKDRPYKKPMHLDQAVKIMGFMIKDNHLDKDLFQLFIDNGLHMDYARQEMEPKQYLKEED